MGKATIRDEASGSESETEYPKPSKKSAAATNGSNKQRDESEDDDDEEDDDGDEEEYEIEAILEAKLGTFPQGRAGYLVKWKGYSDEHNSWVDEQDAEGARELIDQFWSRQKKTGARKSDAKPKPPPKPRKSVAKIDDGSGAEEPAPPAKKRGRPAKAREPSDPMDMDEDEDEDPAPKKKTRKSTGAKAANTKRAAASKDDEEEKPQPKYADMKKWKNAASWEHLVETIDTVERENDGELVVYFTLKNGKGHGKENSEICKQKMPLMLLEFYESNLRWKPTDENAMEE